MLDEIIEALVAVLDIGGSAAGDKNRSPILRVFGVIMWLLIIAGAVWLIVTWFS